MLYLSQKTASIVFNPNLKVVINNTRFHRPIQQNRIGSMAVNGKGNPECGTTLHWEVRKELHMGVQKNSTATRSAFERFINLTHVPLQRVVTNFVFFAVGANSFFDIIS